MIRMKALMKPMGWREPVLIFATILAGLFFSVSAMAREPNPSTQNRLDKVCSRTAEYGCYTNHKYGYTIAWPKQLLTPQGESDAGDGQAFTSKDGRISLAAWAIYNNVLEQNLPEAYQQAMDEPNQAVTYKHLGKDFFVVSGHKNGKIFYRKTVLSNDVQASFEFEYDSTMQNVMDPIIKDIAASFTIDALFQWR